MEKFPSSPSFPRIANQNFLELSTPAMSDSGSPTINYHEMYANGKVGWILVVQKGEHASGSSKEENNLGSDAPLMNLDRNCAQLKNAQALESALGKFNVTHCTSSLEPARLDDDSHENESENNLADTLTELGYCMMELQLRFAQICDMAIGGQELGLISFVLESGKAKGQVGKGRDPPESWPMLRTKSRS
uniref:Uncharacterized protein n=1 Tax=Salix viminalis TaxID=40686 RepID=A0A6N2MU11_SALVM